MAVVAGTVALNTIYRRAFVGGLVDNDRYNDETVASSKKHNSFILGIKVG